MFAEVRRAPSLHSRPLTMVPWYGICSASARRRATRMRREKDVASSFLLLAALFATTSVSFAAASVLKDSDGHMLGCVRGAGAASSQLAAECDVHVMACTFLTFRYEWRYLREWIAHHGVAGVASFAFWIDALTSNTTPPSGTRRPSGR